MKFLFWVFLLFPCVSFGGITQKTVHINAGYYITHNNDSFPAIAFNETSLYNQQNFISQINNDDSLIITLVNNDSISHSFYIKTHINIVLSPGETKVDTLALEEGIYSYADNLNNQKVLGGGGIIVFGLNAEKNYFWNIKEFDSQINKSYAQTGLINIDNFNPDFFEVNGKSKKELLFDSLAYVKGNVGDTIRLFIANHGFGIRSIHFHGYHCSIIFSSKNSNHVNRIKDTFPLFPNENLVLELIPDKPGLYPVHDHNLTAVTGGGIFPNGIFMMMDIEE